MGSRRVVGSAVQAKDQPELFPILSAVGGLPDFDTELCEEVITAHKTWVAATERLKVVDLKGE
jgi:hypothetical protein